MAANWLEVTVRFLHILFGIAWIGALLYTHVIGAALRRLPPPQGGPAMLAIGKRGLPASFALGVLTILFGVWNQFIVYGELSYQDTTANVALGVALIVSLALLALLGGVQIPTLRKLEAMAPKGPPAAGAPAGPPAGMLALQKRMMMMLMVGTVLALVAVLAMVVATLARTQGW